jgi:hypothetical protein
MARYSVSWATNTAVAVADANAFTDAGYPTFIQGGNSTQRLSIYEVYMGGEDTAATACTYIVARDSTVAATAISGNFLANLDGSGTAPGTLPVYGSTSTTKPQRSSTLHLLGLSFNTFGGIVRWVAAPGSELITVGNTASLGEISISSKTGTGKTSGHVLFEVA